MHWQKAVVTLTSNPPNTLPPEAPKPLSTYIKDAVQVLARGAPVDIYLSNVSFFYSNHKLTLNKHRACANELLGLAPALVGSVERFGFTHVHYPAYSWD
jgi:hypothetical protein